MIFGRTYTKTIIWQNDVTSAPPPDPSGPRPFVAIVNPQQPKPFRGQVILGAAAADIYFSGPCIATPMPPRPAKSTSVVQTPTGPRFGEMPPAPFVITRPSTAVAGPRIVYRQAQDGTTPDVSGPTPTTLVITRPRPTPIVPSVMTLVTAPEQAPTIRPVMFVSRPAPKRAVARILITRPFVYVAPGAEPAPYVKVPTQLALEAHTASVGLDAHTAGITLASHSSRIALESHSASVTLDAHGSSLTLEP